MSDVLAITGTMSRLFVRTNELRLFDNGEILTLQQKWLAEDGSTEWKPIPLVKETDDVG